MCYNFVFYGLFTPQQGAKQGEKMGNLTREDYRTILEMRRDGWLAPIANGRLDHRLDIKNGLQLVACSDCHQFRDMFDHISRFVTERDGHGFIHATLLNGGALLLPMESRVRKLGIPSDDVIIANLMDARRLKGIATVALYAHAPCGAAALAGVTFREIIELLRDAKDRVKALLTSVGEKPFQVACFCHVDYGQWRMPRPDEKNEDDSWFQPPDDGHVRHTYFVPRHEPQPPDSAKLDELENELARLDVP